MKPKRFIISVFVVAVIVVIYVEVMTFKKNDNRKKAYNSIPIKKSVDTVWRGRSHDQIPHYSDSGKLIGYGYQLIANTSQYLGPKGTVKHISNGMNCQNCHLNGGTAPYANNFGKVCATYPLFMPRSNSVESVYDRINDCFERSLNGKALDSNSAEMRAMYAYIKWLDAGTRKGEIRGGTSNMKLNYMDVAANSVNGKQTYAALCKSCHGADGQGKINANGSGYVYPPLWGNNSYNDGAGLYRISSFASFVKNNMPFGTDYHNPVLSDADAWNVAAFINSQPRPHRNQSVDWKDVKKKPIDFPFGPYADTFSQAQHKYGPFNPIKNAQIQNLTSNKNQQIQTSLKLQL